MAFPTIALVGQWDTAGSSTATHRANMPAGIVAGDLLLVFHFSHTTGTWTPNAKWSELVTGTGFTNHGHVMWAIADGSETGLLPLGGYPSAKFGGSITYVIRGYTGDPEGAAAWSTGTAVASIDAPALTPAAGAGDWLWFVTSSQAQAGATATPPAGYGSQVSGPASGMNALSLAVSRRELAAASEDPASVAWSGAAANAGAYTVAVRGTLSAKPAAQAILI